jgi:multisubunit Na+/H+ antiporter MnhB subunit
MLLEYIPYFVAGLAGTFLHVAKKVSGRKIGSVFTYIEHNSRAMVVSILTYALIFWAWVENPDLAVLIGLPEAPSILVLLLIGYNVDSLSLELPLAMGRGKIRDDG